MSMKLVYKKQPVSEEDKKKIHEMCEMVRLRCDIATQELKDKEKNTSRFEKESANFKRLEGAHKSLNRNS